MTCGSASASRKTTRSRHVPPFDEPRRQHDGPQRAPTPLAPRQQAVDQEAERAPELLAGAGFRQVERLAQLLARPARTQWRVAPVRQVVRQQPGTAEAVGDDPARQRSQVAERRDAQPLERLDELGGLGTAAQQRHRPRREIGGAADPQRPPDACAVRSDHRAEAGRPLPDARARQRLAQLVGATGGEVAVGEHPDDPAAVQPLESTGVEARLPRAQRLDLGTEALQARHRLLPRLGDADRIRRHERQPRAARERLAHPHARMDAERLRGLRHLADEHLAPGLGSQCGGFAEQARSAARGDRELESIQENTDDHDRTDVRISAGRTQVDRAGPPHGTLVSWRRPYAGPIDVRQPYPGPLTGLPLCCRRARRRSRRSSSRTRTTSPSDPVTAVACRRARGSGHPAARQRRAVRGDAASRPSPR